MVITKAKDVNVPPQMRRTGLKPDVSDVRVYWMHGICASGQEYSSKSRLTSQTRIFFGYPDQQCSWIVLDPVTEELLIRVAKGEHMPDYQNHYSYLFSSS